MKQSQGLNSRIKVIIVVIILLCAGAICVYNTWVYYLNRASDRAIRLAESAAAFLSNDQISVLEATPDDFEKPEYQHIKDSLVKFKELNGDIYFAYLYTQKDDKIYFMVDSEAPGSEGYSPPGQEYPEATQTDKQPFIDGKSVITKPAADRWGIWVSALVPIKDQNTGKVIAVFGIDYSAKQWYWETIKYTLYTAAIVISILLLILVLCLIMVVNKKQGPGGNEQKTKGKRGTFQNSI
ncbi:hypothetical protein [Moorella sulfitireducens (nom. illeg.)]|uniref:hypothetical protein n=1 Tax=Neomoorella sulfitireducens TaxID=2972948 RepID=UPI0021AC00E0|nr:hypothetical protein [Moorella sulfitireducens]